MEDTTTKAPSSQLVRLASGFVDKTSVTSVSEILSTFKVEISPGEEGLDRGSRTKRNSALLAEIRARVKSGEDVEGLLPFRSKADRGLRLIRFPDLYELLDERFWPIVLDYDYILALNLAVLYVRDRHVFDRVLDVGIFDAGLNTFMTNASRLSTKIKFSNLTDDLSYAVRFIELDVLTGYRNLPDPSFNYWRDVSQLASSGRAPQNWEFKKDVLRSLFPVEQVVLPKFEEWVESLVWLTAGSSSIGKVTVEVDGEKVKFRARKNCVPYVLTLEEVLDVVRKQDRCVNKAILKNELKKVRIAVASDIANYLLQAYFLAGIGDSYKNWPGNTLAETAEEERDRLRKMAKMSEDAYGLPFDYAQFDHQPSRDEILAILARIREQLSLSDEQVRLYEQMIHNLRMEVLVGEFEGVRREFRISGGLMSGYRITSLVGNCWNTWMTECAAKISSDVFGFRPLAYWIRGDDSAVYFKQWHHAILFRTFYDLVQADGNDKKFGILWERMEFLRTAITPKGCFGYPNRAAAGITQRKPWSGERWQPTNVVTGLVDAVDRTARRAWTDLSVLKEALLKAYARKSGISELMFYTPQQLGGAGLLPFKNVKPCRNPKFNFRVDVVSPWFAGYVRKVAPNLKDVDTVVQNHAAAVVTADDVPGISRILRKKHVRTFRSMTFEKIPVNRGYRLGESLGTPPRLVVSEEELLMMEAREMTWGDVARKNGPVWNWVRKMERRGCPRWLTREFVSHNAPGVLDMDSKFRGLLSAHVLREVSKINAGTVTGWLSAYNVFIQAAAVDMRSQPEYYLYGHM